MAHVAWAKIAVHGAGGGGAGPVTRDPAAHELEQLVQRGATAERDVVDGSDGVGTHRLAASRFNPLPDTPGSRKRCDRRVLVLHRISRRDRPTAQYPRGVHPNKSLARASSRRRRRTEASYFNEMGKRICILCETAVATRFLFHKGGFDIVQCASCGLVSIEPLPTPAELDHLYSFGANYHAAFRDSDAARAKHLGTALGHLRYLPKLNTPTRRLLDVGCSAGFFLKVARDHGWDVEGVELSRDTSALARELYSLNVHCGRLQDAPCAPCSFDVITLWDVIEHDLNPADLLARILFLLKPGGTVVLSTPNIDGLFPRWSYRIANIVKQWRHPEPPFHVYQFSTSTITRILEGSGFRRVTIRYERIPLAYSFGSARTLIKSPRRLLHACAFAPAAVAGPWMRAGDAMIVSATRSA